MKRAILAAVAICIAAPANAQSLSQRLKDVPDEEWIFQAERLIDIAQTSECLHNKPGCRENNPLLGHHPSDAKLIAGSMLMSAAHLGITMALYDENPKAAKIFATVSCFVEAGVIGWNLRVRFK